MRPMEIAAELFSAYRRREGRSIQTSEVFLPHETFFEKLVEDWVHEKDYDDIKVTRTIPSSYKINGIVDCRDLTDEWWRCFLANPFNTSPLFAPAQPGFTSPFLFKTDETNSNAAKVYMIGLSGFKSPDVRRIVVTERVPILIPIYNMSAASEEQLWDQERRAVAVEESEVSSSLTEIVLDDLCGLYEMTAKFDNSPITGCTVIRNVSYLVRGIPNDNVRGVPPERLGPEKCMNVCHGGFYILLNPECDAMKRGEHLLYFKATSVNFEIEAKVHIGVIVS